MRTRNRLILAASPVAILFIGGYSVVAKTALYTQATAVGVELTASSTTTAEVPALGGTRCVPCGWRSCCDRREAVGPGSFMH
jgi:hypothetical protein